MLPMSLADIRQAALSGRRVALDQPRPRQGAEARSSLRRILLALDGSPAAESAVPYAHAVARAFQTPLTLIRILEAPGNVGINSPVSPLEWEAMREQAHRYLEGVAGRLVVHGALPAVHVGEGRPAEQIIRYVNDDDTDLIVLSSHGEGGRSSWALSQTAHMVVSAAATSVLLIPANGTPASVSFRRLLVPLDCSMRSEVVLPAATQLALSHEAELILCYMVPEPELPNQLPPSREDHKLIGRLIQRSESKALAYLERLAGRLTLRGVRCDVVLRRSHNAASGICALADTTSVDLVMLAAHGAGDRVCHYGSVAEQVIHHGRRPLFIVHDLAALPDLAGQTAVEEPAAPSP